MAAPAPMTLTSQFHIIQPVVVWNSTTSPGPMSACSRCSLACSSSVPPWPCTMHLGAPVVPDENSTNSA
jgi:hypothetical protein